MYNLDWNLMFFLDAIFLWYSDHAITIFEKCNSVLFEYSYVFLAKKNDNVHKDVLINLFLFLV